MYRMIWSMGGVSTSKLVIVHRCVRKIMYFVAITRFVFLNTWWCEGATPLFKIASWCCNQVCRRSNRLQRGFLVSKIPSGYVLIRLCLLDTRVSAVRKWELLIQNTYGIKASRPLEVLTLIMYVRLHWYLFHFTDLMFYYIDFWTFVSKLVLLRYRASIRSSRD